MGYESLNRFVVYASTKENPSQEIVLIFLRSGLSWKLSAVRLPDLEELQSLTSRQSVQASAAAGDLRTINSAEIGYAAGPGNGTYGTFTELEASRMLPMGFSSSANTYTRNGYTGILTQTPSAYSVVSSPISISAGSPSYFTDESGAIRVSTSGPASASTPP